MHSPPRRRALVLILLIGVLGAAPAALAQGGGARQPQAEQFVQAAAQRVVAVLADRKLSVAQKDATFHQAINELADVPKVTNFVLGKYARTITPAQREQLRNQMAQAFGNMATHGFIDILKAKTPVKIAEDRM